MKTDELFHEYFQIAPQALFELIQFTPACVYQFSSPVVKASEKRMDGLLEPAEAGHPRFFIEVQGYTDPSIYWRMVGQIALYHEQRPHLNGNDWKAVIIFLDTAYDPGPETLGALYQTNGSWLIRGELSDWLTHIPSPSPILNVLRPLAARTEHEIRQHGFEWLTGIRQLPGLNEATHIQLLTLLIQFISERFTSLKRKEIEDMLQLTPFEETVAGKEWMAEGIQKGLQQGLQQGYLKSKRDSILEVLEARFGKPSKTIVSRLKKTEKMDTLTHLLKQASLVHSIIEFEQTLTKPIKTQG